MNNGKTIEEAMEEALKDIDNVQSWALMAAALPLLKKGVDDIPPAEVVAELKKVLGTFGNDEWIQGLRKIMDEYPAEEIKRFVIENSKRLRGY